MPAIALLVLDNGAVHLGAPYGAEGAALGATAFSDEMIGCQRPLTDPANAGAVLVLTTPHVGISGFDAGAERTSIGAAGVVIREEARPATWTTRRELGEELAAQGVVGIRGIDTRAVTRLIRDTPGMRALIVSGSALPASAATLLDRGRRTLSLEEAYAQLFPQDAGPQAPAPLFERFASHFAAHRDAATAEGKTL